MIVALLAACRREPSDRPPRPPPSSADSGHAPTSTGGTAGGSGGAPAELRYVAVDLGDLSQGCGLVSDGSVRCWGPTEYVSAMPRRDVTFQQVSITNDTLCGVLGSGQVGCWCPRDSSPCPRDWPATEYVQVESASWIACARSASGLLDCARGGYSPNDPLLTEAPSRAIIDFDLNENVACAVYLDGTLGCWGDERSFSPSHVDEGEFGPGGDPPANRTFLDVEVGPTFGCALDSEGEVYCWGHDSQDLADPPFPTLPGPFAAIAADGFHACGLRPNGRAECWGNTTADAQLVEEVPDWKFDAIGVGRLAACGVRRTGELACWGDDDRGFFDALPAP